MPGIFLGGTIIFGSFCSIASPFLDVLEQKLAEEVQENGSDEGESGNEEEMDRGEEDLINYRKCRKCRKCKTLELMTLRRRTRKSHKAKGWKTVMMTTVVICFLMRRTE